MRTKVLLGKVFLVLAVLVTGLFFSLSSGDITASAAAGKVRVRYNGKTHTNKSKKLSVKYNKKKISKNSYKALVIKGSYMAPYTDVFKSGVKASCKYSKSKKKLTISKNDVMIEMTVGSRTAYVDGEKVKLPTAPLSVRYVSKKKTKILVPVNYIAKALHLTYKKSGSTITLGDSLHLSYDDEEIYYTGVKGSVYYNHTNYNMSSIPVIKIDGTMYGPAEEIFDTVMGLDYSFDPSTGVLTVGNEDLQMELTAQSGSDEIKINGIQNTLSAPVKMITDLSQDKETVCIPIADVMRKLDYTRSWNKANKYYAIQSKNFFDWTKELSPTQIADTAVNYVHSLRSDYSEAGGTGSVNLRISGSSSEILKTAVVRRANSVITITLPSSHYILDKNQFANFGEIIEKMDVVTAEDGSVQISLTCINTADFSYVIQNNELVINVLYTYSNVNGSVTDYALSIPKPEGISFDDVSNQDLYASKKFKIIIQGDHVNYFNEHPVVINNNYVKGIAVAKSGSTTQITVTTSSLRGYKIYDNGDSFAVKIGEPKKIYKSVVVLDAGHGGHDPGAKNKGTKEKDLNFKILYTLMTQYCSSNAPDIKVYWTRTSDTFISLSKRAAFAKSVGADAFISLHMNSASKSSANGTEVYYSVKNNSKSFSGITSKKMANMFKTKLVKTLGTKSRGTKTAGYYVIKHNTVPAILIELGFISGSSDYKKLVNTSFQKKAAKAIYDQIEAMFDTYPTGR